MEEKYWQQFMTSGTVSDYLYYKGMEVCGRVMQKYSDGSKVRQEMDQRSEKMQGTGDRSVESDNSNWAGAYGHAYWRV